MEVMMDIVSKFCKAEKLVPDSSSGTSVMAKTCLQLSEHWRFVRFKKYYVCFQDALPSLLEVYEMQFLSPDSTEAGSEEDI